MVLNNNIDSGINSNVAQTLVREPNVDLGTQPLEEPNVSPRASQSVQELTQARDRFGRARPEARPIRFRENPLRPFREMIDAIPAPREGLSVLGSLKAIGTSFLNLLETASGELDSTPEAIFQDALELGAGTAPIAFAAIPRNAVGTFGGRIGNRNRTDIEQKTFREAQLIEGRLRQENRIFRERGLPTKSEDDIQDQVFDQTGWFRSPLDNEWRFWIDDSQFQFGFNRRFIEELNTLQRSGDNLTSRSRDLANLTNERRLTLQDVILHPALFEAYPELRDVNFRIAGNSGTGSFNPLFQGTIFLNGEDILTNVSQAKSILLHEVQHAIQKTEKFPDGANVMDMLPHLVFRLNNISQRIFDRGIAEQRDFTNAEKLRLEEIAQISRYIQNPNTAQGELGFRLYRADPGEIESRVVQSIFEEQQLGLPPSFGVRPRSRFREEPPPIPIIRREAPVEARQEESTVELFRGLAPSGVNLARTNPFEEGALFFSRDPEFARVFAGTEGTVQRTTVNLGNTQEFNPVSLITQNNTEFLDEVRNINRERAAQIGRTRDEGDPFFEDRLRSLRQDIRDQQRTNRELRAEGLEPEPITIPQSFDITGAIVRIARRRGLDSGSIRGLREGPGGDTQQVFILNRDLIE